MTLVRVLQIWSLSMAKRLSSRAIKCMDQLPPIQLIPISSVEGTDILRVKEIEDIVAQIVLIGQKRGRPSRKEEETKDAA